MDVPRDEVDNRRARANRLYWSSEAGVNEIADELDLSKGALYALIDPRDAGLVCPECGTEMQHANRTARERGLLRCPACGLEDEERVIREAARTGRPPRTVPRTSRPATSRPPTSESPTTGATRSGVGDDSRAHPSMPLRLVGGALLGLAGVLLVARWTRR